MSAADFGKSPHLGLFKPTLIIHGGAGAIHRRNLPPELYDEYRRSLLRYLSSTRELLDGGASALEAACHAVSLLEDDPLFNCGRGSVFTTAGTIEMEASVMVSSINKEGPPEGSIKRAAAVSLVRNTRHPILLAKELLVDADPDGGLGGTSTMHCHLSGLDVERWGWEKGLERKEDCWFWTKKRWDEHRRGLKKPRSEDDGGRSLYSGEIPSQGTVGAVCMDSWGNLCVTTSTGGLTNKAPGRIGDTPTIGAGFWAESWEICSTSESPSDGWNWEQTKNIILSTFADCLPSIYRRRPRYLPVPHAIMLPETRNQSLGSHHYRKVNHHPYHRRAVAMSGTGNGDSFLRVDAVRSVAAIARLSTPDVSLAQALKDIVGVGGELQRSAGDRWMKTGEGQGGIVGIEIHGSPKRESPSTSKVVFDFNCGGLWRAWYRLDPETGEEAPTVMVFKDEYKA